MNSCTRLLEILMDYHEIQRFYAAFKHWLADFIDYQTQKENVKHLFTTAWLSSIREKLYLYLVTLVLKCDLKIQQTADWSERIVTIHCIIIARHTVQQQKVLYFLQISHVILSLKPLLRSFEMRNQMCTFWILTVIRKLMAGEANKLPTGEANEPVSSQQPTQQRLQQQRHSCKIFIQLFCLYILSNVETL